MTACGRMAASCCNSRPRGNGWPSSWRFSRRPGTRTTQRATPVRTRRTPARDRNPGPGEPDHAIRIVGAVVNPIGPAPEHETVTILNASPSAIDLSGWQIADKLKNKHGLSGTINAGATLVIALPPTVQLGNKGGIITLLDNNGLKVDGVAYTGEEAKKEGWTLVF